MEIVPLTGGEKSGAEALRGGDRVARLVGTLGPTHLRLRRDVQPTA